MGGSLSTAGAHEGVVTVHDTPASSQQDDEAFLRQLVELPHSLPILPDSIAEPSGMWARALRSTTSQAASSSTGAPIPQLDAEPFKRLVTEYQRFTRWHCRRIVEQQEKLNAAIPKVEQQAFHLQQRMAETCRARAAEEASMAAVGAVQRELEDLAERLQRLGHSLAEVERQMAVQQAQQQPDHAQEPEAGEQENRQQ